MQKVASMNKRKKWPEKQCALLKRLKTLISPNLWLIWEWYSIQKVFLSSKWLFCDLHPSSLHVASVVGWAIKYKYRLTVWATRRESQFSSRASLLPEVLLTFDGRASQPSDKQVGTYPGLSGMTRPGVFLLPSAWDASPSQGYPPVSNSSVPIYTPGWRERCPSQDRITMSPARAGTRTVRCEDKRTDHEAAMPSQASPYICCFLIEKSKNIGTAKIGAD